VIVAATNCLTAPRRTAGTPTGPFHSHPSRLVRQSERVGM